MSTTPKTRQKRRSTKKETNSALKTHVSLQHLYNIRNNVLEMLNDRGYSENIKKNYADLTYHEFEKLHQHQKIHIYTYKNGESGRKNQCIVYFMDPYNDNGKNKAGFLKEMSYLEQTFEKNHDITLIIIAEDKEINDRMKGVEKYIKIYDEEYNTKKQNSNKFQTAMFYYSEISVNKTKHTLVPHHILLTTEEANNFLINNNIKKDEMAIISQSDPIVKYYGGKIGDVFKIIRKSPTTGIAPPFYRVVGFL